MYAFAHSLKGLSFIQADGASLRGLTQALANVCRGLKTSILDELVSAKA